MGVFEPPPTPDPGSLPDIPILDFNHQARQAAQGVKDSGIGATFLALWIHRIWDMVRATITFLVSGIDEVAALLVQAVTAAQGVGSEGMISMMAGIIGDLLGIEANEDAMRAAFHQHGRIGAMTQAGGQFFDMLRTEWGANQTPGAMQPSMDPAKSFIGFLIEFAVRQGNLAMIAEILPIEINILGWLREYGEILAKNLGLGRLARRALQPLVQTLVADPLQWSLNQQYRPKLLSEGQAMKAYFRGALTQDQLHSILAMQGYTDGDIARLTVDMQHAFSPADLLTEVRWGNRSTDSVATLLQLAGWTQDQAGVVWDATMKADAETLVNRYCQLLHQQFEQGFVTSGEALDLLQDKPLTPLQLQWWQRIYGLQSETARKHLSESQVEKAFLEGIIDLSTAQDYWQRVGFNQESIQVLTLLMMQKLSSGQKTKVGHVTQKALTEAQLEKAYQNGIINLAQFQAGLVHQGYSADDQDVLVALVQVKTPGPGETQLPGLTTP